MLLGNEPDRLASHLLKTRWNFILVSTEKIRPSRWDNTEKIRNIRDKSEVSKFLTDFCKNNSQSISTAVEAFDNNKLLRKDDKLDEYFRSQCRTVDGNKGLADIANGSILFVLQRLFAVLDATWDKRCGV